VTFVSFQSYREFTLDHNCTIFAIVVTYSGIYLVFVSFEHTAWWMFKSHLAWTDRRILSTF